FRTADSKIDIEAREDLKLLLRAGVLCNNAELINEGQEWKIIGDPTEGSLLVAAEKAGLQKSLLEEEYHRIKELPFDSKRKRMTTINKQQGETTAYVKGAPDGLLEICDRIYRNGEIRELRAEEKERILEVNSDFARGALRVLAIACKPLSSSSEMISDPESLVVNEVEQELVFLGLMGMIDPPRREVTASVQTCKKAGIRPLMITGDYTLTARAIAEELGIYQSGEQVVSGAELAEMTDLELEEAVQQTVVFARVSPAHKSRIVKALQKKGEIVAMTGDGVNDAPALKEADIGVAMGITGTDVSKGAADMVLTDDNFSSIVAAVGEGRGIYENIKKFICFLLSCNTGEIMLIFTAIALGLPVPLLPAQILWVNLVTDGLPALALGVDPAAGDLMQRPPRDPDEGIFEGKMGFNILSQGIFIGIITLLVFYYGLTFFSLAIARTMAFAALSFSQLSQALNSRSNRYSLRKIGVLSNRYLVMALCASGLLQLAVMFLPFLQGFFRVVSLNGAQWFVLLFSAILPLLFVELIKKMGLSYRRK
ncbi:MAG TPA: cation-translocating P-type ATPase, partial [Halanaerobiales bacterium]|nr:cation-translocating P-type ATPase [Halanaerobiales bacterium]